MSFYTPPFEMPYVRPVGCELCGAERPLRRVVLKGSGGTPGVNYACARTIYVCDAHAEDDLAGPPLAAPQRRMAPGTTAKRPQAETLL